MNAPPEVLNWLRRTHAPRQGKNLANIEDIPAGPEGTEATIARMIEGTTQCAHHPPMKWLANRIVEDVPSKDYEGEARSVFEWVRGTTRYTMDPRGLEWVQGPCFTAWVEGQGDCFVKGTRVLLREGMRLVPVEAIRAGDEIWGHQHWSRVIKSWGKGILPTWMVRLNNGSAVRLTPDHNVWVAECPKHRHRRRGCACPVAERDLVKAQVRDLRPGMVVPQPDRVDYGTGEMDPDRAYVEGLYLSDGWSEDYRFSISGKDGHPKEAQKLEVQTICERLGISTSWRPRHIRVNDREWAQRMARMGKRAPLKQALSINLIKPCADRMLKGILADAGKNTNGDGYTFTSTSRELWLQTRVLLRMQGASCSSRAISDHGGLGQHPIYRLGIRAKTRADGKAAKLLRVKSVFPDDLALPCWDLQTEDQHVWLPEADWTVHNCDDMSQLIGSLALALGHGVAFRTVATDPDRPGEMSHVYPLIGIRKNGIPKWIAADATQTEPFGWEPPTERVYAQRDWVIAGP